MNKMTTCTHIFALFISINALVVGVAGAHTNLGHTSLAGLGTIPGVLNISDIIFRLQKIKLYFTVNHKSIERTAKIKLSYFKGTTSSVSML